MDWKSGKKIDILHIDLVIYYTKMNIEKLRKEYLHQGYTEEEVERILESHRAVEEERVFSAEEIYKRLLIEDQVYA